MFNADQIKALSAPLSRAAVKTRTQSGRALSYIEGWHAISEANRIFGFDAWSRETLEIRCVTEGPRTLKSGQGFGASYIARVRIRLETNGEPIVRDGVGAGHGQDKDLGLAHESAIKEAETDAMKRALMTFGNPFGLALYDKDQTMVANDDAEPADDYSTRMADGLIDAIAKTNSLAALDQTGKSKDFRATFADLDPKDKERVKQAGLDRRAALETVNTLRAG